MKVYLAGPMTGLPLDNYPAFRAAAKRLRAAGYKVSNPAENPKPVCGTWLGYMRMGIKQLVDCEGIVLLPGWRNSRGASAEFELARAFDFPFFEMPPDGADVPTPDAFRAAWFDAGSQQIVQTAVAQRIVGSMLVDVPELAEG